MHQQKQYTISQINTGRSQQRVLAINNQSKLSYLLTSRRAAAAKYIKGFRQTQTKILDDFVQNHRKKSSMSVFKESLMTLDSCVDSPHRRDKKLSQDHNKIDYSTINPQVITTRKRFIEKHLKTQAPDDSFSNLPLGLDSITHRYKKTKPMNTFRSRVGKLNSSVHRNSIMIQQSPYKTKATSPDSSKRMKSQPSVRFTSILSKKVGLDIYGYQYVKQLGTGGYARVVLAKKLDQQSSGYYAIKIYDKVKTQQKSKVTNIPREIKIMHDIIHPNICRIQDQYESKTTFYIVMEYCGTQSLFRRIGQSQNGYFLEPQAKMYFKKILSAFIYLHDKRIAHRDVKAQNILIMKGEIKLIDFGFSVIPNSTQLVDSYCGTPAYMAPEIFNRTPYNPFHAQIWSLGVLLYLMLQGLYPFLTTNEDELVHKIKKGSYKFIKPISESSKNLIKLMLNPVPCERIPLKSIREHHWLQDESEDD